MSGKSKRAAEQEDIARQRYEKTQRESGIREEAAARAAEERLIQSGKTAHEQMIAAGAAQPEETARLAKYSAKAAMPGEQLLKETGPISQAVARRVQERVDQPGLDYTMAEPAFAEGVTTPLWRTLKARGIAPRPGTEGGLGTQQFMQGAIPELARLRAGAVSEDIARGERYGETARGTQRIYEEIENLLGETIRGRQYESGMRGAEAEQIGAREGVPYGPAGAEARSRGETGASGTAYEYKTRKAEGARAEEKERDTTIGKILGTMVGTGLMLVPGGQGAGMSILGGTWGGDAAGMAGGAKNASPQTTPTSQAIAKQMGQQGTGYVAPANYYRQTPQERILAARMAGRGGY